MMPSFRPSLKRELAHVSRDETGQTIVEYALIIVLVALAVLLANPSLTAAIAKVFADASSLLGYRP
jgi:Flp pilus assembly pilin Flp